VSYQTASYRALRRSVLPALDSIGVRSSWWFRFNSGSASASIRVRRTRGRLFAPLAVLASLNSHHGAFRQMPQHCSCKIGSAPRAEVSFAHNAVRADLAEGEGLGALRADRNRMIVAVLQEQGSLVRHQHKTANVASAQ
jgi:hypothetical protein